MSGKKERTEQVALVFGGTKGIGKETSLALARDGFFVYACGRNKEDITALEKNAKDCKLNIQGSVCDVENDEEIKSFCERAVTQFGRIDATVFSVGKIYSGNILSTTLSDWDDCFKVNLRAPFIATKNVLPEMIKQGGGSIVFVSTIWALTTPRERAAYLTAKTALTALARSIAIDHGEQGIRANAVAPGYVDTEYLKSSISAVHGLENVEHIMKTIVNAHPPKRIVRPEEVAEAILFLASDRSSAFNGQTLTVDGGASTKFSLADIWKSPD